MVFGQADESIGIPTGEKYTFCSLEISGVEEFITPTYERGSIGSTYLRRCISSNF